MSDQQDKLIGKELGQYTIQEEIGRGGMATVYSATQRSMNRIVAVKVLPQHFMHDPNFLERFEREVEVISQLEHPHILPIYDYGEADSVPYIAMRFLGGGSMAQMVRRGVPALLDLVKPFTQVADALDYAHQRGIIHRDLKPGNIMLDENDNAYLSDFGIARVMGSELTGSALIGTPAYMSPEQAHGQAIDSRSDIYSLGIVLFEIITGREPFQAETPMSLLLKHISDPIPPLAQYREDVPEAVQHVIEKATEKDPDNRYASAGELAKAFADAVNDNVETRQAFDSERTIVDNPTPLQNVGGTIVGGARTPIPATGENDPTGRVGELLQEPSEPPPPSPDSVAAPAQTGDLQRNSALLIAPVVIIIVVIVGGLLFFLSDEFSGGDDTPLYPTPFPSADQVIDSSYAINVPQRLMPSNVNLRYDDRSDASRLYHVWDNTDNDNVFITMALVSSGRLTVETYDERYYGNRDSFNFIDESQAPDGTIRRSYRVVDDSELPNGQMDVFYIDNGEFLAAIEMFTSDAVATDATQLETLQAVLDSVRLIRTEEG